MKIRPATPAELPVIAALHVANWPVDYEDLLPESILAAPTESAMAERWSAGALEGPMRVQVPCDATGLTGVIDFDSADPVGTHVDALHVAHGRRGAGVCVGLLGTLARLAGGRAIWFEVLEGNALALANYAHWGGVEGQVFTDTVLGSPVSTRRVTWADSPALAARIGDCKRK